MYTLVPLTSENLFILWVKLARMLLKYICTKLQFIQALTLSPLDSWVSVPCPLGSCGKSEEINNIYAVQEKHSYVIKNHSKPCLKTKIMSFCSNKMSMVHLFHSTYFYTEKIGILHIIAKITSLCGSHENM